MSGVPPLQGLVLFEVYEASGALLLVTSAGTDIPPLESGDVVIRRAWATAVSAEEVRRG